MTALIVAIVVIMLALLCFYNKKIKDKIIYSPVEQTDNVKDDDLIKIINNYRFLNGFIPLKVSSLLCKLAEQKAKYMTDINDISHEYFTVYEESAMAIRFDEMVAKNYSTPASFFKSYLKNDEYKENIENENFNWIGSATVNNFNCVFFATY